MNKREVVELESSFLSFVLKAQELGYTFVYPSKLELQHSSESKNSMSGKVVLEALDFLENKDSD